MPARYTLAGFYDAPEAPERELEQLSKIEGLDGVGFIYPDPSFARDPDVLVTELNGTNLGHSSPS